MAGFVKRNWGGAPAKPQQAQGAANGPTSTNPWSLSVKFADYTEKGNLEFKVSGFYFKDVFTLNNISPNVFKFSQNGKTLIVTSKVDAFLQVLPTLESELKKLNHYKDSSIDNFSDNIEKALQLAPTQEELKANNTAIITNWKQLLQTLNDPETKQKFLLFQTTYTCQSDWKKCALSPANVVEVRLADPLASFVTDANTWLTEFNRKVQPGSPFVIITKPDTPWPPRDKLDAEAKKQGYKSYSAMMNDENGRKLAFGIRKDLAQRLNLATSFYKAKVYDVRFTVPIDPSNDKFLKVANLVNNLTGELNQAAKEYLRVKAYKEGAPQPDVDAKKEGIQTPEELLKYKDFIIKKCAAKKITIPDVGSTEDVIANAIYTYAYKTAEAYNVLSPKAKQAFASAVLYSVAKTINLKTSQVSQAVKIFDSLSTEEVEEVAQKTFETFKQLANFSVSEAVGDGLMSFDDYRNLLMGLLPNKNRIKKNFDDFNDRMNNI